MKNLFTIILPIFIGLGMLGVAIWFFFLAKNDNTYLLLFGFGTAILVPISLSLMMFGLNFRNRKVNEKLSELSKITDIQVLLDKTKSKEEQIEILKTEYKNLEKNLRYNSEKISLELRRDDLVKKAKEIISELDSLNNELEIIDTSLSDFKIPMEVELLRQRVFEKQVAIIRINNKSYSFNRNLFPDNILFDSLFLMFKDIEKRQKIQLKKEVDEVNSNEDCA